MGVGINTLDGQRFGTRATITCLGAAFLPYLALVLIVNFNSENRIPVVGT